MRRWPVVLVVAAMAWAARGAGAGEGRVAVCIPLHGRVDEFMVEALHKRLREADRAFDAAAHDLRMREVERMAERIIDDKKKPRLKIRVERERWILFDLHSKPGPTSFQYRLWLEPGDQ